MGLFVTWLSNWQNTISPLMPWRPDPSIRTEWAQVCESYKRP
jgi:hypothetical protein